MLINQYMIHNSRVSCEIEGLLVQTLCP